MPFWPSCFFDPFSSRLLPALTSFRLSTRAPLMLVSDSSPLLHRFFHSLPFIVFHLWLSFNKIVCPFFRFTASLLSALLFFFCSTSPTSPPLPAPPPQGQEGAQEAQEARPQRGRAPRRRAGPGPQPRPLLNQKKKKNNPSPLLFLPCCRPQFACIPVVPSSRPPPTTPPYARLPAPHCPALPLAPPLALRVSLYHSQLWGPPKCCKASPGQ